MAPLETITMRTLFAVLLISGVAFAQAVTETFASAKLSGKEIRDIISAVEQSADDTPVSWEKELRVRRVDLGGGAGLVVRGTRLLCGATGNCEMWVFRKAKDRWVSLFEDPPIAEGFEFASAVTNGLKDLTVTANLSADTFQRTDYRFDGSVYRAQR
jgi:hypothetical protein